MHALLNSVISSDLEWLSKIFSDMKRRAVSLRQLIFLFNLVEFHLHLDVVGPLLFNASLLLVLTTDYGDWLVQVT